MCKKYSVVLRMIVSFLHTDGCEVLKISLQVYDGFTFFKKEFSLGTSQQTDEEKMPSIHSLRTFYQE